MLTQSRLSMWETCPTKANFHYVQRLRPRGIRWPLVIGRAVHAGMEAANLGAEEETAVDAALSDFAFIEPYLSAEETDKYALEQARIEVYVRAALRIFPRYPLLAAEQEFTVPIVNPQNGSKSRTYVLGGKADGIVLLDGKRYLLEYKTSGITYDHFIEQYGGNRQITLYSEALQVEGAAVRYIGKTRKQPQKGETLEGYKARLLEEFLATNDKVVETFLFPTPEQRAEFQAQLWHATQVMGFERRRGVLRKNYHACADCEFHAACYQEDNWQSLYTRSETSHDELQNAR
ncbi:PD-(D/E)XK nuclease family protein [Alicyclobacillus tolerans]|nr:PD-(D/E)XK nuclease family protein [Alicyclobacillus montanus]